MITPRDPSARGCQLSSRRRPGRPSSRAAAHEHGVICDFREPDVIRVAPVPLYNTFHDCWRAADALARAARSGR